MTYTLNKKTNLPFNEAVKKATEALKKEGFGIITEVDLKQKFKEKLNLDFRNYLILGACNPAMAYQAIQIEPNIGVLLPCNFLVQEHGNGDVEIAAVNPLHSIGSTENAELDSLAKEISEKIKIVLDGI